MSECKISYDTLPPTKIVEYSFEDGSWHMSLVREPRLSNRRGSRCLSLTAPFARLLRQHRHLRLTDASLVSRSLQSSLPYLETYRASKFKVSPALQLPVLVARLHRFRLWPDPAPDPVLTLTARVPPPPPPARPPACPPARLPACPSSPTFRRCGRR